MRSASRLQSLLLRSPTQPQAFVLSRSCMLRTFATWNRPKQVKKQIISESSEFGIEKQLEQFDFTLRDLNNDDAQRGDQGVLVDIQDKVACVQGLDNAHVWGLVKFERSEMLGLVVAMEKDIVKIAPLGNLASLNRSDIVHLSSSFSPEISGPERAKQVDDALLQLLTSQPNRSALNLFAPPSPLVHLDPKTKSWTTGVKVVDFLKPLRVGCRIGIVGHIGTGMHEFVHDICSSAVGEFANVADLGEKPVTDHIVWVGFNGPPVQMLQDNNLDLEKWTMLNVTHKLYDNKVLAYLAPFVAMSIARNRRDSGEHVVVVIDNVAAHAEAAESVLGAATPAQPIASVLEHCGQLDLGHGGGAISCFALLHKDESVHSEKAVDLLGTLTDDNLVFEAAQARKNLVPCIDFTCKGLEHPGAGQPPNLRQLTWKLQRVVFDVSKKVEGALAAEQLGLKAEYEPDSLDALQYHATLEKYFSQAANLRSKHLGSTLSKGELVVSLYMAANGYLHGLEAKDVHAFEAQVIERCNAPGGNGEPSIVQQVSSLTVGAGAEVLLKSILKEIRQRF